MYKLAWALCLILLLGGAAAPAAAAKKPRVRVVKGNKALLKKALASQAASALPLTMSAHTASNNDCPATCLGLGLGYQNVGTSGRALCMVPVWNGQMIEWYYGTFANLNNVKGCHVQARDQQQGIVPAIYIEGYACMCHAATDKFTWSKSLTCQGSSLAITHPTVCRYSKYMSSTGPWVAGWLDGSICKSGAAPQGKNGDTVFSATAGAPGWTVHALCMASVDKYSSVEGTYYNGDMVDITASPFNKVVASPSQCGLECTKTAGCLRWTFDHATLANACYLYTQVESGPPVDLDPIDIDEVVTGMPDLSMQVATVCIRPPDGQSKITTEARCLFQAGVWSAMFSKEGLKSDSLARDDRDNPAFRAMQCRTLKASTASEVNLTINLLLNAGVVDPGDYDPNIGWGDCDFVDWVLIDDADFPLAYYFPAFANILP